MTSQVSQPLPPQAPSTLSYASTAKKAVSSPAVAVGGSAPAQQNGRNVVSPAVPAISAPAVAHGSSAPNGAEHNRTSSVTISANGTSGYVPNGGPAGGIKFGFQESPAASHSTPQISQSNTSAPIPIPGSNPRVTSPAQSPSPIPQPTASGGRPPSTLVPGSTSQFQIGSFEGDRNRQAGVPQGPTAPGSQATHLRRESNHSAQGDQTPTRGGFSAGGRGRGGFNPQNQYHPQPQGGFSPAQNFRQPPGRGGMAGGMAPSFTQGRPVPNTQYGSPNLASRSPAMASAQPGTPNMNPAMPIQSQQQYNNYYAPQMHPGPQVNNPSSSTLQHESGFLPLDVPTPNRGGKAENWRKPKGSKNQRSSGQSNSHSDKRAFHDQVSNGRNGYDRSMPERAPNVSDIGVHSQNSELNELSLPPHSSEYQVPTLDQAVLPPIPPTLPSPTTPCSLPTVISALPIDAQRDSLKPENFGKLLLTNSTKQQSYGYPPQGYNTHMQGYPPMNGMNGGAMMYPQMGQMAHYQMGAPQSPQPGYTAPYHPGQYGQQGQPMSRNASQMSEPRPASSMGQQPQTPLATPVVHSTHTPQAGSPAPSFKPRGGPRKSQAIVIKKPDGEALDIEKIKAPASPAPKERIKTPPAVASTPPPKSATPQHARTDSAAVKTASQIQAEIKEKVQKAAAADSQAKADEEAKAAAEAKAAEEKKAKEEAEAAEAAKAAKAIEDKAAEEKAAAEKKAEEEAELERQIEEMERAELEREKKEAEILAKRKAEKEIADKANAEKEKIAAEENDRKLREQEREMERLEDEKEAKRLAAAKGGAKDSKPTTEAAPSTASALVAKISSLSIGSGASTPASDDSMAPPPKVSAEKRAKPAALNLAPLNTKPVEPPQPSAALQSLKSARFLTVMNSSLYPENIRSPNPALNSAVTTKGKSFKYDKEFLLQFQKVFVEKPSIEFDAQVKALIGDPSDGGSARSASTRGGSGMGPRGSNRNNPPGAFAMGSFGANASSIGGKTLPPGTTSAERFAMSGGSMPRPTINPMASFTRPGGAFSGGNSMTRNPSSSGMNNVPQSPRQGSRRGGDGGSKRNGYQGGASNAKQEAQAAKTMPLTAGMDLKPIQVTASGWKPRSIVQTQSATGAAGPAPGASGASGLMDPEMVQRKVKAALNKMTPEKFDKIADQILLIAAQSKDESDGRTLRQVIQLTFEKATDEAHWASMYAKFCKRMLETMSPDIKDESILDKNQNIVSGGNLFRKYLLNRCQEEFERGWKMDIGVKPEGEQGDEKQTAEAVMLSDDYYKEAAAKRRGLGLVQFIGELYKLSMLTERIMHECVKKLVDYNGIPDEAEIESLTKLLKTIGLNLDSTEKGKPLMDVYFSRIQSMIDTPELPSRLRFMLMDIVDLRKKNWQSKETNKGPKTLDEVRIEAEQAAAQKAAENNRGSQRGGGGGGRMQQGRGDSRNFSNQYGNQPPVDYNKNTVGMDDLRRLGAKGAANRNSSQPMSFGPTSMFSSRSNSGRKMGPGGNLTRGGEDSGASSRTGTPPQQKEKESATSANAFSLLAGLSGESEHPTSPPSTATSPELSKSSPAHGKSDEKKEGE